jgi:hypothetical protein
VTAEWTAPAVEGSDFPMLASERELLRNYLDHFDLRWVHFHLVQEYARHLGHADIVGEQVDGVTGA